MLVARRRGKIRGCNQPIQRPARAGSINGPADCDFSPLARRPVAKEDAGCLSGGPESGRGNESKAAAALGITRTRLHTRPRRFGLEG